MKANKIIVSLIFVFSLFHFSTHTASATEAQENGDVEGENVENEEVDSSQNEAYKDVIEVLKSGEYQDDLPPEETKPESAKNQLGDMGEYIVELKQNLTRLGFGNFPSEPTDYLGKITVEVIKEFQDYYHLAEDGTANKETLNKINDILSSPYQTGNEGSNIKELKMNFLNIGYGKSTMTSTDEFDSEMEDAVRKFQSDNSLAVNGIIDERTLEKVEELTAVEDDQGEEESSSEELAEKDAASDDKHEELNKDTDEGKESESIGDDSETAEEESKTTEEESETLKEEQDEKLNQSAQVFSINATAFSLNSNFMQRGDRSDRVQEMKLDLMDLGFGTHWDNPTTFYGPETENVVREFQGYYDLSVDGVAGQNTLGKIDELLSSPYQYGNRSKEIQQLKENLVTLGYANWESPTNYYGPETENVVRDFQASIGLAVNGIMDEVTRDRIAEASPEHGRDYLIRGDRSEQVQVMKLHLVDLGFGTHWDNPTTYYGPETENVVREFQAYYELTVDGIAGQGTLGKIEELLSTPYQYGNSSEEIQQLKENLVTLGYANWDSPTNYYGPETENVVREFQASNGLAVNGLMDEVTRSHIAEAISETDSMQRGDRSEQVQQMKLDLVALGFGTHWENPTTYYGPETEQVVREFQAYYALPVNGIIGAETLAKIEEVLASPYQYGNSSEEIQQLKEKLVDLGYVEWNSPTTYYGPETEDVVRDFQASNDLAVNGIMDEVTRDEITEATPKPDRDYFQRGDRSEQVQEMKLTLVDLGFGTHWENPTTYYGPDTEKVVREFQAYYGLSVDGVAGSNTLGKIEEILSSPYQFGSSSEEIQQLKEKLVDLGYVEWNSPTTYYGPETEDVVRDFQASNDLAVNGIMDEVTRGEITEATPEPDRDYFQRGDRSEQVQEMKLTLVDLGFGTHWENPTTYYGPDTENVVREFQAYYGLSVDGVAGSKTLGKIEEILSSPYQFGSSSEEIQQLKEELVIMGYANWPNPTNYYGPETEKVVRLFQEANGLAVNGIMDEVTRQAIETLSADNTTYTEYNISLAEAAALQTGLSDAPPQTDMEYDAYVSKTWISNNRVTANVLNVRGGPGTNYWILGQLSEGDRVTIIDEIDGWYQIEYTENHQWVNASPTDVLYYLDPTNFLHNEIQRFQFLDLSRTSDASVATLNNYLDGKGILEGRGQAFINASRAHGVNDIYLASHASLETGNGTSELATGVRVGENNSGDPVLVTSSNEGSLKNIETVYNMYGIGAVDNNALEGGAIRAYERGWLSPYDAIVGGAAFIGNDYVKAGQNTLYKMRWNPDAMENGAPSHQYATDIGWASKQVSSMYNLYQQLGISNIYLDIPLYR